MRYFNLGDEVWVSGKVEKIIETVGGKSYELSFKGGYGGWSDKITLPEAKLVEKAGAEKCCSTCDDIDKESIQ